MQLEDVLLCSQQPAIRPYPEPDKSSRNVPLYFTKIHLNFIHSFILRPSKQSLSFEVSY
jgi:hypothetical protein